MSTTPIQRLLAWAKELGMNQSDLARKMNVSPQDITNWKKRGMPPEHHLVASSSVGRTVDELLGVQGQQHNKPHANVLKSAPADPIAALETVNKAVNELNPALRDAGRAAIVQWINQQIDIGKLTETLNALIRASKALQESEVRLISNDLTPHTKQTGT